MIIDVYFESQAILMERFPNSDEYFHFRELLDATGMTNEFSKDVEDALREIIDEKSICIFSVEDMSGLNSHIFERVFQIINMLSSLQLIERLVINNPVRPLQEALRINSQYKIDFHESKHFDELSEQKIIEAKEILNQNLLGQKNAKLAILRKLISQLIRPSEKPLVLMFYGNPGIGKTEAAKLLSESLYGTNKLVREQMSMAHGEHSVNYFKATGHNEDSFSKKLMNRDSNIILLDEFALAPYYIQTSFFQMFDEGKYVDQNFEVDMRNSIIICTSNLLSREEMNQQINPALLTRFDGYIRFDDFSIAEKRIIARKTLDEYLASGQIKEDYLKLIDPTELKSHLDGKVEKLSNVRGIRNYIEDNVSQLILDNVIEKN